MKILCHRIVLRFTALTFSFPWSIFQHQHVNARTTAVTKEFKWFRDGCGPATTAVWINGNHRTSCSSGSRPGSPRIESAHPAVEFRRSVASVAEYGGDAKETVNFGHAVVDSEERNGERTSFFYSRGVFFDNEGVMIACQLSIRINYINPSQ